MTTTHAHPAEPLPAVPAAVASPAADDAAQPRLRLADAFDRAALDGAWWPRSRDLAVELPVLLDHLPDRVGRVVHAVVSPPDWDEVPRRVSRRGGQTKVGSYPRDDTHLLMLSTSTRVLRLMVVPPGTGDDHARTLMVVASHAGNGYDAGELLAHDVDDMADESRWSDEGGQWWGAGGAPSERAATV